MVGPAEEYLEYLRAQRVSPNTVKSYARALALWWQFLELFGLDWDAVTLENFGAFLSWLRTGDGPAVASIERRRAVQAAAGTRRPPQGPPAGGDPGASPAPSGATDLDAGADRADL